MKTFNVFMVALVFAFNAGAADVLTEKLQRGLFEEEANHNLDAAIKEYQSVVAQSDEQRKVTATALFRLGECYRKLGRTNEAQAQYQRIVRDFSEQEQLVKLSRDLLPRPSVANTSVATVTDPAAVNLLREEIGLAEQAVQTGERALAAGRANLSEVLNAKKEVLRLKRQLPENAAPARQRALLEEQIDIVKQHFSYYEKLAPDRHGPSEVLSIQRELLSLQRELATAGAAKSFRETSDSDLTQAETEALARVKTLARNSPDLLQNPSKDGLSELQLAARDGYYSVVEFILSQGISPNGPERGSSPVALAASRGHLRIIELLLDRRADVNREDGYGKNALILAAQQGFKSVVELLLARGANVNHADNEQKTALIHAAQKGFTAVAELLLEREADVNRADKWNSTALHYAAAYGFAPMTKLLLEKGAKPDVLSSNTQSGNRPERNVRFETLWVDYGATALHLAAKSEFVPVVQALLAAGASANVGNYAKVTPLHLAAEKGNSNICALLLEKGADPNVEDAYGNTPFSQAITSGRAETVALFVAKGADINRAIVFQGGQHSYYPLHLALDRTPAVLEAILQAKPKLEVVNTSGRTPLQQAADQNKTEMVEKLLAAGANPNQRTSQREALFAALYQNEPKPELVAALLKHGANPNIVSGGQTPLGYAESRSKTPRDSGAAAWPQIVALLRQHGANEYLQRLSTIGYTRPAWTSGDRTVFYRGTNDYNRYTLFELLTQVFASGSDVPFPDFSRVTLERLEGTNAKPRELALNIEEMMRGGCSNDMWLEWGDRISFPELDHPLTESWLGISKEMRDLLIQCGTRRVQIVVKQETNVVKLVPNMTQPVLPAMTREQAKALIENRRQALENQNNRSLPPTSLRPVVGNQSPIAAAPPEKFEKTLLTFRLKEVVYGANILRASSDPARVRVIRRDVNSTNEWLIDLTKVAMPGESRSVDNPAILPGHDLWLRDGDVIEIPEKQ